MDWDEIFKIGRHTDSAGRTRRTWTKADLGLMVEKIFTATQGSTFGVWPSKNQ